MTVRERILDVALEEVSKSIEPLRNHLREANASDDVAPLIENFEKALFAALEARNAYNTDAKFGLEDCTLLFAEEGGLSGIA